MTEHTGAFDPATVPPFPVYTLLLDEGGTVHLDGIPIEPAPGHTATEAGVAAVARKAAESGLSAVRVRAHVHGQVRDMVITAAGEPYDTTVEAPAPRRRRRLGLLLGGSVLAVVLAGTGIVGGLTLFHEPEPVAAPAHTPPPGAGTEVPAALPTGYTDHASWAVPVADRSHPAPLDGDQVLTVNPNDQLEVRTAAGARAWTGSAAPNDAADVYETSWLGRPVFAHATSQRLTLWPRDTDTETVSPVTIDLEASATLTYAGTAPLIDLGDFTVAVPAETGGLTRLTLPAGTRPAVATAETVISVGDGTIATVPTNGSTPQHRPYAVPEAASGTPSTVIGLDEDHALALWPVEDERKATTAVIELSTATLTHVQTINSPTLATRNRLLHDREAGTIVVDGHFLAYREDSPIVDVSDLDATAITGRALYGVNGQQPAAAQVNHDRLVINEYEPITDEPLPVTATSTTGDAYMVIPKVDHTILYRIPQETP